MGRDTSCVRKKRTAFEADNRSDGSPCTESHSKVTEIHSKVSLADSKWQWAGEDWDALCRLQVLVPCVSAGVHMQACVLLAGDHWFLRDESR